MSFQEHAVHHMHGHPQPAVPWWVIVACFLAAMAVLDTIVYWYRKGKHPGPVCPIPFVGGLIEMVVTPVRFWQKQLDYNPDGISINSVMGLFTVFITNSELCRKVYTSLEDFILFAHPNAKHLFGAENLIYMDAEPHKKMRALLIPGVYSKPALEKYLKYQQEVVRKHLGEIADKGEETEARLRLRLMNAEASQESFVGPYLQAEEKDRLAQEILDFTMGFLSAPVTFAGGLKKAIAARESIRGLLRSKAVMAEGYVRGGGEPRCVLDFWLSEIIGKDAEEAVSYEDIATTILDFMFASQDATTSAVVWAMDILGQRPEVVEQIRAEVATHNPDGTKPLQEFYGELKFVQACALEVLRCRPPVPMVPHLAKRDVQLTKDFKVPKGAMVIPSITGAAKNEPHAGEFTPEKPLDPNFNRTFVFGAGQHKCPGRMYASQLLGVYIAILASEFDWTRRTTDKSNNIIYFPTLFPEDNWYTITRR